MSYLNAWFVEYQQRRTRLRFDEDPPGAVNGVAYSYTLSARGGLGPYVFAITDGALPDGLGLAAGVVSGTPTTPGTSTVYFSITDANGTTAERVLEFAVT